jgi:hypothetical protein
MQQKIKIVFLFTAVILLWNNLSGQNSKKPPDVNCPEEKIQLHLTQECVFSGEILWFKIYCTSFLFPAEGLSSLAFIELVSSENTSIIRKKILLKHGEGPGEFEIPDNLPTGLYYILAYTNWMKNFGEESFLRKEIMVVNPDHPFKNTPDSLEASMIKKEATAVTNFNVSKLKVVPDKKKYATREKVMIKIRAGSISGKGISGDFSVAVYRKEPPMIFRIKNNNKEVLNKSPERIVYLPDYKGIRLSGKLTDPSDNAVAGAYVTASMPGPGTDIKSTITDSIGIFHFLLKSEEGEQDIVISIPDADKRIRLEESFWNGFRDLPDNIKFDLNQDAISYLKEKFIHFQLQNRFKKQNSIKNTPVKNLADSSVFYTKPYQTIEFKNYISLDSLGEYFYELVPSVKFNRRKEEFYFSVIDPLTLNYIEEKSGVFLDGVLYDNYAGIATIPLREIDRMAILPSVYYYKDFTFGGIIDIHTKKSDFNAVKLLPNMTRFIYPLASSSEWKFTSPDYSIPGSPDRIPDFRYLLYWEPNIRVENSEGVSIKFYTGDIKGTFVVKVVGISDEGEILQTENEIIIDD